MEDRGWMMAKREKRGWMGLMSNEVDGEGVDG
jgi:hypothetical protein